MTTLVTAPHRKHRGRKNCIVHSNPSNTSQWRIAMKNRICYHQIHRQIRKPLLLCLVFILSLGLTEGQFDFELDSSSANQGGDDCSMTDSCDGYSDSQYEEMNGNGGEHYNFNRMAEDDYCKDINNSTNVAKFGPGQAWCLPKDYNQEKTPFTFLHLTNKSLPWEYNFTFVVEEISNINDKDQTMSISMYFGVSWLDPRLQVNETAAEWTEVKTGPRDEVNVSPQSLRYIWYPELEIYGLERFGRQRVLKEMSGVRIRKNKTIHYELGARITISCRMNFDDYPLDAHTCQFQVGSYYDTNKTVQCVSSFIYDHKRQRSLQHYISFYNLNSKDKTVILPSGSYAACGFQLQLVRKTMQFLVQVYLPSGMFVVVSWVSFLIKPEVVPGRMALLVTLFLVLINIFNSVRERAPISTQLNAVDLYLVVCIFLVLSALLEYALILLLLKKRRKPKSPWTIEGGLKSMFNNGNVSKPMKDRRATNIAVGSAGCTGISPGVASTAVKHSGSHTSCGNPEGPLEENSKMLQEPNDAIQPQQPISRKIYTDPPIQEHIQAVCDNIDAWAMWIAPPVFVLFNIAYWISYQHSDTTEEAHDVSGGFSSG